MTAALALATAATACSRSAPARATRRRSSGASHARSTPSSATPSWPTPPRHGCATLGFDNVHVLHGDGTLGWRGARPVRRDRRRCRRTGRPRGAPGAARRRGPARDPDRRGPQALQTLVRVTRAGGRQPPARGSRRRPLRAADRRAGLGRGGVDRSARGARQRAGDRRPAPARGGRADRRRHRRGRRRGAARAHRRRARRAASARRRTAPRSSTRSAPSITQALIRSRGFTIVAAEADWPDAARIHRYVKGLPAAPVPEWRAFARFPAVDVAQPRGARVRRVAARVERRRTTPVGFYGLDLYSLYRSIRLVLDYLDRVDPDGGARRRASATAASRRGKAIRRPTGARSMTGRYRVCEDEVVAMLRDLLGARARRTRPATASTSSTRCATRASSPTPSATTARCTTAASASWNLRDQHMFETLEALLRFHGPDAKAVLWEHNSHLGDAAATEMGVRGRAERRPSLPRRRSAIAPTSSASAPTTAPSPPRTTGTARCR